jgi:hypothetical protein
MAEKEERYFEAASSGNSMPREQRQHFSSSVLVVSTGGLLLQGKEANILLGVV